jgi:hypothetical protein
LAAAFFQDSRSGAVLVVRVGSFMTSQSSQNPPPKTTAKLENPAVAAL